MAGGKIILAGGKIILAGGKIILAGGKIILAGGKIILARFFLTSRRSSGTPHETLFFTEFLNSFVGRKID